jgi:hypothetical protein
MNVHRVPHLPSNIDYRCDVKKKLLCWGDTWYHCVAEDSRIQRMPVINHLQVLVHPQTQKKLSSMDCQSPTRTSQNSLFW